MTQEQAAERRKLSVIEHAICAWPVLLIVVGGALGGAWGGLAWALNTRIMAASFTPSLRYLLIVSTGLGAAVLYLVSVFALASVFPGLFAAH